MNYVTAGYDQKMYYSILKTWQESHVAAATVRQQLNMFTTGVKNWVWMLTKMNTTTLCLKNQVALAVKICQL